MTSHSSIHVPGLSAALTSEQAHFLVMSGELIAAQGRGGILLAEDATDEDVPEGLAAMRAHAPDRQPFCVGERAMSFHAARADFVGAAMARHTPSAALPRSLVPARCTHAPSRAAVPEA
jgi:hypothetical protein